jgi:putative membrane protein
MHGFGGMGFGMGWGWIIGLFVLVAIIWIVARTISTNNTLSQTSSKTILEILEERYARGEIDIKEFEEKIRTLNS